MPAIRVPAASTSAANFARESQPSMAPLGPIENHSWLAQGLGGGQYSSSMILYFVRPEGFDILPFLLFGKWSLGVWPHRTKTE